MHWANGENLEERKEAYMEEKRLCARPVIELTTMREYADVHDALKFGSRYADWKKIVAICDAKGEPTSETTCWRGERCAYDRPCHMYDLQRAIEGGWEYKGFHFEYMVPPSVSGER